MGDKEKFPHLYEPHHRAFKRARELGLKVTMHAGEVGESEHVKRAIEEYGATRIGHGYRIIHDTQFMEHLRKMNIHFEVRRCDYQAYDYDHTPFLFMYILHSTILRNVQTCPTSS